MYPSLYISMTTGLVKIIGSGEERGRGKGRRVQHKKGREKRELHVRSLSPFRFHSSTAVPFL